MHLVQSGRGDTQLAWLGIASGTCPPVGDDDMGGIHGRRLSRLSLGEKQGGETEL